MGESIGSNSLEGGVPFLLLVACQTLQARKLAEPIRHNKRLFQGLKVQLPKPNDYCRENSKNDASYGD
jgi:hypothetical protein